MDLYSPTEGGDIVADPADCQGLVPETHVTRHVALTCRSQR